MRLKKWLIALLAALMSVTTLIAIAACKQEDDQDQPIQEGPETGVYYYDVSLTEEVYKIALNNGNQFTFLVMGENKTGTYTLTGETLVLDFAKDEDGELTATLADNILSLTYDNSSMRFLKEINYTVTFDSQGGGTVNSITVLNGKSIARPADPTLDNHIFVGWYSDKEYTKPFAFGAQPVTSDMTLYAYWIARVPGSSEYTVDFDLGSVAGDDAQTPASVTTIGGCVIAENLPVPELDGYEFCGWYVSAFDDENKLTYEYTAGTPLSENTTLYALWAQKDGEGLSAPEVSVTADGVTWNRVSGANSYRVTIVGPDASVLVKENVGTSTTYDYDFASQEMGEYTVTVEASSKANVSDDDDTVVLATRYYNNKALSRVSVFSVVEPSALVFEGVPNAERYYLTIECGNPDHNHERIALGSMTNYNFASCPMAEGGIKFTVTAEADGWVSSVSKEFVYNRELAQVSGFTFDAETETIYWDPVPDAMSYIVSVSCGNSSHAHDQIDIGNRTSYCLKTCAPSENGIVFSVYPRTKGYNSPVASTYTYQKTTPATPDNVRVSGKTLVWDSVGTDVTYTVRINGKEYSADTNRFDLSQIVSAGADFAVSVRTNTQGAYSLWSDAKTLRLLEMTGSLTYSQNILSWNPVVGAEYYEVRINNGEPIRISDGENFAKISLTQAGNNVITVSFSDGTTLYEGLSITVYAYEIVLDSCGGSETGSLYVAYGDAVTLPSPERDYCDFIGWYTVPTGPEFNGTAYTDTQFTESGDIILYAYWKAHPSTVTLVSAGGSLTSETVVLEYGEEYSLEVPGFTDSRDERYVFTGWYSKATDGVQFTDVDGSGLGEWATLGNITLYAQWLEAFDFVQTVNASGETIYSIQEGPNFDQLDSVRIPAEYRGVPVERIYSGAFSSLRLESIEIPDSIQVVGSVSTSDTTGVFTGCDNLMNVYIYAVEGDHDVYYSSVDGVLLYDNPQTHLTRIAYYPAGRSGAYRIPDSVEEIPLRAFAGANITTITVPANVQFIRSSAFYGSSVGNVVFEEATDSSAVQPLTIEDLAFQNCLNLKEFTVPQRAAEFDADEVFFGCTNLSNVYVEEGNALYVSYEGLLCSVVGATINDVAYSETTVLYCPLGKSGALAIPSQVAAVGANAFEDRDNLTKITFHAYLTSIGANAFAGCAKLCEIEFLTSSAVSSKVQIGDYAFYNCTALSEIVWSDNVASIGRSAFAYCESIQEVMMPGSVTSIGANAFQGCYKLQNVEFSGSQEQITVGEGAFSDCVALTNVTLSATVVSFDAVNVLAGCDNLEGITVDPANLVYESDDGVLYTKGQRELLYYPKVGSDVSVTLPDTVTTIGEKAFAGNTTLESITIGKNITMIEANAFDRCTMLTNVIFEEEGDQELTISQYAFANCPMIASLTLPERLYAVEDYAFNMNGALTQIVSFGGVTTIGAYAFAGTGVEEIEIPSTVTLIGTGAFDSCASLVRVTFPASMQTINSGIFSNCPKLSEVVLPEGVTEIGANAFEDCIALSIIELPSTLVTIGEYAFSGCTAIEAIEIPASVTTVGAYAFDGCSKLASLTFAPNGTEDLCLGNYAFQNTSALKSVEFPARLAEIGSNGNDDYTYVFNKSGLESVTFEEGESRLKWIGRLAFAALSLKTLELPEGLQVIGTRAFYTTVSSPQLESVVIPSTVTLIAEDAFYGQSALESVTFASYGKDAQNELTIEVGAFTGAPVESLALPKNLSSITGSIVYNEGQVKFNNTTCLSSITLEEGNENFVLENGVLYSVDRSGETETREIAMVIPYYTEEIVVSDKVSVIPDYAFHYSQAKKIVLPEGITEIGEWAFSLSMAEEINVPASVTTIGRAAFGYESEDNLPQIYNTQTQKWEPYTSRLKTITFDKAAKGVEEVPLKISGNYVFKYTTFETIDLPDRLTSLSGSQMFQGNNNLKSIEIPANVTTTGTSTFKDCSSLVSVTFAEGSKLTKINTSMFENSGLETFTIPKSVTSIANTAFKNCDSLTTVDYEAGGTEELQIANGSTSTSSANKSAGAFKDCDVLTTVSLPARLTLLGAYAFADCSALTTVTFEEGSKLAEIGNLAFWNCGITDFVIPAGVTKLGTAKASDTKLSVFMGCKSLVSITLPDNYVLQWNRFLGCTSLGEIRVNPENVNYSAKDGVLFSKDGTTLVFYPDGKQDETYAIPKGTLVIGEKAFYRSTTSYARNLTGVTIPEGVTEVGIDAFKTLPLTSVLFPSTLTTIGNNAFASTDITEVTIPASVSEIQYSAFQNCSSLVTVNFAEDGVLETIGNSAFKSTALTEVVIPVSVTTIGSGTFQTASITSVTFAAGSKLTMIDAGAFEDTSITEIVLPDTVTTLGAYAFRDCPNLERVTLPASLTQLNNFLFSECDNLNEIVFPEKLTTIKESAFAKAFLGEKGLRSIEIPATVQSIEKNTFQNCTTLESVSFEEGSVLTTLGTNVFGGCTALTSVELPVSVSSIPDNTFKGCTALEEIDLPMDATSIGTSAFEGCTSLIVVGIPGNVAQIGNNAFKGCTALTTIDFASTGLTSIGDSAFQDCSSLTAFELPSTLSAIGTNAFAGTTVQLTVEDGSTAFVQDEFGAVYDSKLTTLISFPSEQEGEYVVPDSVTSIPEGVFRGSNLTSIVLPASVTVISDAMFENAVNLTSVTMKGRITSIGERAFAGSGIQSITIGRYVTSIGASAFEGCTALSTVTFEANGSESLQLGNAAFKGCTSLTAIEIPRRVRNSGTILGIGVSCFEGCTNLATVTFEQTGGWLVTENLTIGNYAFAQSGIQGIALPSYLGNIKTEGSYSSTIPSLGSYSFSNCTALASVTFQYGRDDIYFGEYVFENCTALTEMQLPSNFSWMYVRSSSPGYSANGKAAYLFKGCSNLTSVSMPVNDWYSRSYSATTDNEMHAFEGCTNLTTVRITQTNSYFAIGYKAFAGLTSLENVLIDDPIQFIYDNAFEGCTSLTSIKLPENLTTIGEKAFAGSGLTTIEIPRMVDELASDAFEGCTALASITVDTQNRNLSSIDGNLYNADGTKLIRYAPAQAAEKFVLPDSVTSIAAGAFEGCVNLKTVTIPATVTMMEADAFKGWTAEQTIIVSFAKGQTPVGWAENWSGNATVQYAPAAAEDTAE